MKPASFRYFAPTSVDESVVLLAEHGDAAKILGGGQSLVPMMNFRLVTPAVIIDLNRVTELDYIHEQGDGIAIGAMTRQSRVEHDRLTASRAPLITETMPFIAHPQIRNRGTIGGCIAHADPAAELPAVAVALDARFRLIGSKGARWVPAGDFFQGLFTTALEPTELLTEIVVPPMPAHSGCAFREMSRRHGDYALAGVACTIALDAKGVCRDARIVLLGLGQQPVDARNAAKQLIGAMPTAEAIRAAAQAVDAEIDPSNDIHASAEFRRQLARTLTRRALDDAIERARNKSG